MKTLSSVTYMTAHIAKLKHRDGSLVYFRRLPIPPGETTNTLGAIFPLTLTVGKILVFSRYAWSSTNKAPTGIVYDDATF